MAKKIVQGSVVFNTNKGLLKIYIKDDIVIATVEKTNKLVTFAKDYYLDNFTSFSTSVFKNFVPNKMALKMIGNDIIKQKSITFSELNKEAPVEFKELSEGKNKSKFSVFNDENNRGKIANIFKAYEENKELFEGFCNYSIDGVGNITNIEEDIIKNIYNTAYNIEDYSKDDNEKITASENFIKKTFSEHLKENKENIDDLERAGLKTVDNTFKAVDAAIESEKAGRTSDETKDTLCNSRDSIKNKLGYIEDLSKLGNGLDRYDNNQIAESIANIYMKEKLCDSGKLKTEGYKNILKKDTDKKLDATLEDIIVREAINKKQSSYDDFNSVKYINLVAEATDVNKKDIDKINNELKQYINMLNVVDNLNISKQTTQEQKDKVGIVLNNYKNHISSLITSKIFKDENVTNKTLNVLENNIIEEKYVDSEAISFESQDQNDYCIVVKDELVHIYKDNIYDGNITVEKYKKEFSKILPEDKTKDMSVKDIMVNNNLTFAFTNKKEEVLDKKTKQSKLNIFNLKKEENSNNSKKYELFELVVTKINSDSSPAAVSKFEEKMKNQIEGGYANEMIIDSYEEYTKEDYEELENIDMKDLEALEEELNNGEFEVFDDNDMQF